MSNVAAFPSPGSGLTFEPEGHRYAYNGKTVPNVTTILRDAGVVDYSYCTEFARERGSLTHQAINYMLQDDLDEDSLHGTIKPYLAGARAFLHALGPGLEIVAVEARVYSPTYNYAGTLDLLYRKDGLLWLVDWKTGDPPPATGLQLAAYADAWFEMTGERVSHRQVVRLYMDGDYSLWLFNSRLDGPRFRAALTVANLRKEFGLL